MVGNDQTAYLHCLGFVGAALMCACASPSPATPDPHAHAVAASEVTSSVPSTTASSGGLRVLTDAAFATEYFILKLQVVNGGSALKVSGVELDPTTDEFERWSKSEPVGSGSIERVAMRHTNDWYVVLRESAGTARIERWQLDHNQGAYYSERALASTGIGSSIKTAALVVGIEQDRFIPPAQRTPPSVSKTRLATGLSLNPIESMIVDPDGRYLVMELRPAIGSRELIQVALIASSNPPLAVGDRSQVWDFSTVPELPEIVSLGQHEHPSYGRAIVMGNVTTKVTLWDQENDGVFENDEVFADDIASWYQKYPYEGWSRTF